MTILVARCYHAVKWRLLRGAALGPYYNLKTIKSLIQDRRYYVTKSAQQGALAIGFGDSQICDCVVIHLDVSHFFKTMPSERLPCLWQDVYKITYEGVRVYLKLQISLEDEAVIISFKEDTSL